MNRLSKLLICIGVIFLLCTGALAGFCVLDAEQAEAAVSEAYEAVWTVRNSDAESEPGTSAEPAPEPEKQMRELTVDGVAYVAILELPELELTLPVISQWSDSNGKTAPCRYSGSVYRDDLILCGHNYASHFGKLRELTAGDRLAVSDMDGNRFSYEVTGAEILAADEVEELAAGEWDLTLFTCTAGGKQRFVLRCKRLSGDR